MASTFAQTILLLITLTNCGAARTLSALVEKQPLVLKYHKGRLLSGPIAVNLIWYGNFTSVQRSVISDFVTSLSKPASNSPSVSTWWKTVQKYNPKSPPTPTLGSHTLLPNYPLGKRLSSSQLQSLKSKPDFPKNTINVLLTSSDVAVDGFCTSRCGTHGKTTTAPYVWVGDSSLQCPGRCAWPFHKPIYGPQTPPLVAPNGDVGVDGMVINLAGLLAGTVTNPYGDGFYQGEKGGGLEVASACAGAYGKGAYPGYAGEVMVDAASGGSFNAYGVGGRKYLLPALVDPNTSDCATLV